MSLRWTLSGAVSEVAQDQRLDSPTEQQKGPTQQAQIGLLQETAKLNSQATIPQSIPHFLQFTSRPNRGSQTVRDCYCAPDLAHHHGPSQVHGSELKPLTVIQERVVHCTPRIIPRSSYPNNIQNENQIQTRSRQQYDQVSTPLKTAQRIKIVSIIPQSSQPRSSSLIGPIEYNSNSHQCFTTPHEFLYVPTPFSSIPQITTSLNNTQTPMSSSDRKLSRSPWQRHLSVPPHQRLRFHEWEYLIPQNKEWSEISLAVYRVGVGMYHSSVVIDSYVEFHYWQGYGVEARRRYFDEDYQQFVSIDHLPFVSFIPIDTLLIPPRHIAALCSELGESQFSIHSYDLIKCNCNHFTAEVLIKLGLQSKFPSWINRLAKTADSLCMKIPFVRNVIDTLLNNRTIINRDLPEDTNRTIDKDGKIIRKGISGSTVSTATSSVSEMSTGRLSNTIHRSHMQPVQSEFISILQNRRNSFIHV